MKMKILSAYDVGEGLPTPHGDNTKEPVFSERLNDHGEYEVYQSGTTNFQEMIEAAYPDTLIENILARCGMGDMSGLSTNGFYADVTGFPENIHDAVSMAKATRSLYDSLPSDIRTHFGDYDEFMSSVGSSDFCSFFANYGKEGEVDESDPE